MFISKKDYGELWGLINKQNEQIEELIGMVKDTRASRDQAIESCCDLIELIDRRFYKFSPEVGNKISEIKATLKDQA